MANYDNDMAPIGCKVADLTEGDMVDGADVLAWLDGRGYAVDASDRHSSDCLLWTVADVTEECADSGEAVAVLHTEDAGSWAVPPALEVTCYPAMRRECAMHPTDCRLYGCTEG